MYKYFGQIKYTQCEYLLNAANNATWKINKGPEVDYETAPFGIHKFIKIPPGGWIKRHSDNGGRPKGVKVFHIVLSTNDQCKNISYTKEIQEIHLPQGTVWEFDTLPEHESCNNGDTDRIHLVLDIYDKD